MPKQLLKIEQFHGGLSTNDDPRDIAPNELAAARDIQVDELGKIRPLGGAVVHGEVPSAAITTLVNGYGLFQFSTDHKYSKIVITASADISGQVAAGDWVSDSSPSDNIVFVTAVIISLFAKVTYPVVVFEEVYLTNKVLKLGVFASAPSFTSITLARTPDVAPLMILSSKGYTFAVVTPSP